MRRRFLALLLLISLLAQTFLPLAPVQAARKAAPGRLVMPASAQAAQAVQALYIYRQDASTAQAIGETLAGSGANVEVMQLESGTPFEGEHKIFLPMISQSGASSSAASRPVGTRSQSALGDYDLIILADDLARDGQWAVSDELTQQILDSGRPILGMGLGGALFFDRANGQIGLSKAIQTNGHTVERSDGNASLPLYTGYHPIPLDQAPYALYTGEVPVVAVDLGARTAGLVRYAALAGMANLIPIIQEGDGWALWGFRSGPGQMTETGRQLLANLVWLLTGKQVEIPLAVGTLTPEPGVEQALADALAQGDQYALAQLYHLPTPEERDQLASLGVELLEYLGNTTYTARVSSQANLNDPTLLELVRFLGLHKPEYKTDPDLEAPEAQETYQEALVTFFPDVSKETIESVLTAIVGSNNYRQGATPQQWLVPNTSENLAALAQEPTVAAISTGFTPPEDLNDEGTAKTNSTMVQQAVVPAAGSGNPILYLGLTGQGVTIGHMERKPATAHLDLSGRVVIGAYAHSDTSDHATHTAGIVMGNGNQSETNGGTPFQWRGHAPKARLVNESYGRNIGSGVAYADYFSDQILNYDAVASTHSYVMTYGVYDGVAAGIDSIVRGDAVDSDGNTVPPRLAIFAVANQGTSAQYDNEEGFYSIYAPAKNSLGVGSVNTDTDLVSSFSSRGPTFDGRIKPDVVAPGCHNDAFEGIVSTSTNLGYVGKCGTSMAAPAVAGVVALMFEQIRYTFGPTFMPLPSTIKALLVNTATDLSGTTPFNDPDCDCPYTYGEGPDWATGYGLVNAQAAVQAIRAKAFIEDQVSPANTQDEYTIQVTAGQSELRFTLAWDDEPGSTLTAETSPKLVNNLDLVLVAPDNTLHRPWVLDPLPITNSPGNGALDPIDADDLEDAVRGVNNRDNVEQVVVENPMAGTWTIRVTASSLPNGNPQKYSLVGDFRQLNIVSPQTGDVAEAGDPANPNIFLVVLEATQPYAADPASSLADASAGDFQVEIDGHSATIISGMPVGDQFWLNVRPQAGIYAAGNKYDLTVRWLGHGQDSETKAVLFTSREVTDRAIVLDHSGSMSEYDKMAAAQNAARLFVDQSLVGDRVAVVGFSTNAATTYPITEVSADPTTPELNAAKAAINAFVPTNMTAIGKGLLEGQNQVTAPPADFSEADVIVLLSDGLENVTPYYDTPAVKGVIEPSDTIVHTVAVGPASAGHHELLAEIADDNGGESYSVTEDGMTAADLGAAAVASISTGIDAWPTTLDNRLGDVYKQIAEEILGENRLFQATGMADPQAGVSRWQVEVPEGLERLTVAVNWSIAGHQLRLVLVDPSGKEYRFDPKSNPFCRSDATHETCIIEHPEPGSWLIVVEYYETGPENEFVVWASARTSVQFQLLVGTPQRDRVMGRPVHIIGFLSSGEKPLPGQGVAVKVFPVHQYGQAVMLDLYDDGQHGDGEADDGIYANYFTDGHEAGAYAVRGVAKGEAGGAPFELYENTSFNLSPRALYVYRSQAGEQVGMAYRTLLQENGIGVDLVHVNQVPASDIQNYNLVIVGPDTGYLDQWGTDDAFDTIVRNERPVLGLGEGGYAFFGRLKLAIGWPNGIPSNGTSILVDQYSDPIWDYSFEFNLQDIKTLQLYQEESNRVDILLNREQTSVQAYGLNDFDQRYGNVVMESGWWMLWGFDDGPKTMTEDGRRLFVNAAYKTMD
ncbi:MAG: hypothetical protein KatS3mg050_0994 [Litorilinea sp.]|nr:MAG: hypothetical protein KatS3mg050_0994 [Litorilinea sp.]